MHGMVEKSDLVEATPSTGRQRVAERLARYALLILLGSVAIALVGGAVIAVAAPPGAREVQVVDECPDPPCFGGGGLPSVSDLPWILSTLGYGLAILLGLPSLLAGAWDLLRARWAAGGRRLLAFVGPVLFFVGTEIVPHLLNPCYFALALAGKRLPEFYCDYSPEGGADLADRWHLLDHTLVGAIPLAALYWLALRRWRPAIARLRSAGLHRPRAG